MEKRILSASRGDKKIELASKSAKLLLDGGANKIELTASQISINGKQMAELKGQSLKLEGTSVELKAKGTMKAEARELPSSREQW